VSEKTAEGSAPSGDKGKATSGEADSTLGRFLVAARERRGVTRDEAVGQTHIPDHYIRMMESNDYSMISDQLYLLPFLRRYATFLELDPEETAMRFVREVQRSDNNPPARMAEPLHEASRHKRGGRYSTALIAIILLIAALVGLYVLDQERHRAGSTTPATSFAFPVIAPPATAMSLLLPLSIG
jgi:cytoskeleton protein RodZ